MTGEDRKNAPIYLQLLDGMSAGATVAELARHVFGLRTLSDADRDVIKQYHARAVWMTEVGWRRVAGGDVGSVVTAGLFASDSIAMLRLRDRENAVSELMAREPFAAFVAQSPRGGGIGPGLGLAVGCSVGPGCRGVGLDGC